MASEKLKIIVPSWPALIYIVMAIILLPWTIYLGASLPTHHLSTHWDISWTGLDAAIIATMLLTGLFAYLKSRWIIISSSTVGSLLLIDAWFDVISERRGVQLHEAIILAIFIEIPLAIISYYIAYQTLEDHTKHNKIV
jgi:hypothetical protein